MAFFFTDTDWHVDNGAEADVPQVLRFVMSGTCPDAAACSMLVSDLAVEKAMAALSAKNNTPVPVRPTRVEFLTFFSKKFGKNWLEAAYDASLRTEIHGGIDDYVEIKGLDIKRVPAYTLAEGRQASFLHRSRFRGEADYYRRAMAKGTVAVDEFYRGAALQG